MHVQKAMYVLSSYINTICHNCEYYVFAVFGKSAYCFHNSVAMTTDHLRKEVQDLLNSQRGKHGEGVKEIEWESMCHVRAI